jgi:thioredoxin reductase
MTNHGQWRAPYVVLALGRRGTPRKLGVPGEEMEKVMYQLTDACSYRNQELLVVGGGDSAIEAAAGLARQPGNRVTISYRKKGFFRVKKKNEDKIASLIKSGAVTPVFESEVIEIRETTVLLTTPDGGREIPNQYVFVFAGGVPPFPLLKDAGVAFGGDPKGRRPPAAQQRSPSVAAPL